MNNRTGEKTTCAVSPERQEKKAGVFARILMRAKTQIKKLSPCFAPRVVFHRESTGGGTRKLFLILVNEQSCRAAFCGFKAKVV